MISRPSFARAAIAALTASLLAVGAFATSAAAQADAPNAFDAVLSTQGTTVTVDLSATRYPSAPTGLYIEALRNGCDADAPCWSEEDDSKQLTDGYNGTYTLTGLMADTTYQIGVMEYSTDGQQWFRSYVTTATAVNDAPSEWPIPTVSADGIHVSVTAQAEYSTYHLHDGGTIADLRYDVYAYLDGKRYERVLSGVTAGSAHAVSGLPLNRRLTFTETDTNSVGESPESLASGAVTLAPKAPGSFTGRSYTGRTATEILWTKPSAGTGRITKFVVRLDRASKKVYSHTFSAKTKDAEITHLKRHTHYVVFVTAYNDHGKHSTIRGVLTTK